MAKQCDNRGESKISWVSLFLLLPPFGFAQSSNVVTALPAGIESLPALSQPSSATLTLTPSLPFRIQPFSPSQSDQASRGHFMLPDQYPTVDGQSRATGVAVDSTVSWGQFALQPYGMIASTPAATSNDPLLTPNQQSSMVGVGTNLSREFAISWGRVTPYADVQLYQQRQSDWVGDFEQSDQRFNLGVGFETAFSEQAKAFMSYETSLSTQGRGHQQRVYAGLLFNF